MTSGHLIPNDHPEFEVLTYECSSEYKVTSYERAMARQEMELREALAKLQALRHGHDEAIGEPDPTLTALFASQESAASRVASLTPRQRQIMDMVVAGCPSKNIAMDLKISQRTVENHRASIMKRTGARSIPALARVAIAAVWKRVDKPGLTDL